MAEGNGAVVILVGNILLRDQHMYLNASVEVSKGFPCSNPGRDYSNPSSGLHR